LYHEYITMKSGTHDTPTILVVLGATGDLMAKKIVPAVFHLHREHNLPKRFRLLGVSRRDWGVKEFKDHVKSILAAKVPGATPADITRFLKIVSYHKLEFDKANDYEALGETLARMDGEWKMCTNKLFYLSVPPQFYGMIFDNLHAAKLTVPCGGKNEGWTRIIVEKPFGSDEKSAKVLDAKLAKLFKEEQIYRIDHYLAKEAFQNIMAFRFFNNLFENQWGAKLIESIHVRQFETTGLEERGDSYDGVGALRDVGQNHLLQMVALAAMERPKDMTAAAIRASRGTFLGKLKPLSSRDIKTKTIRAQYDGYRTVTGVAPDSNTETYFRVRFSAGGPRWRDVAFTMESGKRIIDRESHGRLTEIEVTFRHPEPCLCGEIAGKQAGVRHYKNSLVFRQDPKEGIVLKFWSKKPGLGMALEERTFEFEAEKKDGHSRPSADYEKLLSDCVTGDQTLFVSSEEIVAMWRFIDPIIAGWRKGAAPLKRYKPDSSAVTET
jgi:glucose-6-phosphate 1-dehydrogenase